MSDLPGGWAWATVGEVADLSDGPFGSNLKTAHYVEDGPRVIRLQNIGDGVFRNERAHITEAHYEQLKKHAVQPGEIVIASLGDEAPRACAVPPWLGPAIVKADCIRARPLTGVEPSFLMWALNSPSMRRQAALTIKGIGRPRLGLGGIRRLRLALPPRAEQRRIVAAIEEQLSRLDAAEQSLRDAISKVAVLRAAIHAAATDGFESGELGAFVAELRYGTSVKCSYDAAGAPVLRIPNIQRGAVDLSDVKYATDASLDLSTLSVETGDLLFVRTNGSRDLIGRVACVDGAAGMAFASYLIRARPDPSRLDSRYAVIALSTPQTRSVIESKAATTAGQYNLNLAALRSLEIPLPPIDRQRSIVQEVEHRLASADAVEVEVSRGLRRSSTLRKAILARAFRGDLIPQNPNDEPANLLLDRIAAARAARPAPGRKRRVRTPA